MKLSLVPPRSYEPEIMDRPGNSYEQLASALRDIARINRWLGGIKTLWRPIRMALDRDRFERFTLLDVGMGGGEIPRAIVSLAARRGVAVHAAGADLDPHTVRYAADQARLDRSGAGPEDPAQPRAALSVLRTDAFALPFADRSFDFVTCSMMFHHFREVEAARLLAELARVSRRAVIVNDLERHWIPWATITLLRPFAQSPMVRHDGPLSVLRAWTAEELFALARAAGLAERARVESLFPFRLLLIVEAQAA